MGIYNLLQIATLLISLAGSILSLIRLVEIFDVFKLFNKKANTLEEFEIKDLNLSGGDSKEQNLSLSISMTNSYLIEFMFFIIQGILRIGREVDKENNIPYSIKYIFFE